MKEKKPIFIELSLKIIIIILVAFIIGVFITDNIFIYLKGLAFGGIFSILKVKLMEITFNKTVVKTPNRAKAYASLNYFMRYLLTAIVLVVGALEPSISLVGVIIGILALKIAAYWQGYIEKPTKKDGSVEFVEWEDEEEEEEDEDKEKYVEEDNKDKKEEVDDNK